MVAAAKNGRFQMIRDAYISDAFRNHLAANLTGYSALELSTQTQLASMILQSASRYRQHSHFSDWASFTYVELERNFGRDKFNRLNTKLHIFEVVHDWSKIEGRTKPFKLAANVEMLRKDFFANLPKSPTKLLSGNGEVRHKPPTNGLIAKRTTDNGKESTRCGWNANPVLSEVPVNLKQLSQFELEIQAELAKTKADESSRCPVDTKNVGFVLDAIRTVLHHANNSVAPGCVIHKYQQSNSGRMYAQGINLQAVNRQVRFSALHGMWDYDIENCHYAILMQMAAKAGLQCAVIEEYLNNKATIRADLAVSLNLTPRQVKKALLALVYGAGLSSDPDAAIPEMLGGVEVATSLYQHHFFKALAEDVAKASSVILKTHRPFRGGLRNACGLVMRTAGKKARHKLAHLLQGVESVALEAAHNVCSESILLLQHDGFTADTPELDLSLIQNAIFDATGYVLKLSVSGPLKADLHSALLEVD